MTVAGQIETVVVGWQVYTLTHDALALGLIGLAEALPFIALVLYAGHIADRGDRRRIALVALSVYFLCAVGLFALSRHLKAPGAPVWPIFAVIAMTGIARSFLSPARTALSAELVPRELYASAAAWRSSSWQLAAVIGPALGGLLYGFGSATLAYGVGALLLAVAFSFMLRVHREPVVREHLDVSVRESLGTGLRFLIRQPLVLGGMTLDMFSVLFGGAIALLPIFAAEILHVGPQGLGLLQAAPAVGAVAMSLILAHRPPFRRAGRALFIAVALFGVATIGFALSRSFVLSLVLLGLTGMFDNVSVVIRSTLLQTFTPVHLLGRVSAVDSIFIGSSNEIGAFESGVTAKLMGPIGSVLFGGVMTLVVVGTVAWLIPPLRKLKEIRA
jgi:MFS family permease